MNQSTVGETFFPASPARVVVRGGLGLELGVLDAGSSTPLKVVQASWENRVKSPTVMVEERGMHKERLLSKSVSIDKES